MVLHAIPELEKGNVIHETRGFDTDKVEGLYAKTKAEATQYVLDSAAKGLNASVVHPSGILGPYDYGQGHLTQLLMDYCNGRLKAIVNGGYDFVDVRDVAKGILSCCEKGKPKECYILSNRYCTLKELFKMLHEETGRKEMKVVLPMKLAQMNAPLSEIYYKLLKQPPLYTAYSLYTLARNGYFSHQKADKELDYHLRPLKETLHDALQWLKKHNKIE